MDPLLWEAIRLAECVGFATEAEKELFVASCYEQLLANTPICPHAGREYEDERSDY
jgi:hypothetical protein